MGTAPAKCHVYVGTCVRYARLQHGTTTTYLYVFFFNVLPPPWVTATASLVVRVRMISSTPASPKSRWFRSGNPPAYMPWLFAGAPDEKLNIGMGWHVCVPRSTSIMELGHVWAVSPKQRARKAHLCPTAWCSSCGPL